MTRFACAIAVAALACAVVPAISNAAPIAPLPAAITADASGVIPVHYWHGHYYRYRWHGHYYRYHWHRHYYLHRHYRHGHWHYW